MRVAFSRSIQIAALQRTLGSDLHGWRFIGMAETSQKRPPQYAHSLPAKRAKFDGRHAALLAPEETLDPLEADIGVGASRKKDIKLDGYASDSSEEGHGVKRFPTLDNENGPIDDEEDDMFGEGPSKQADRHLHDAEKPKKKEERFLDLHDIQGQDLSSVPEYMDIVDENDAGEDEDDDDEDSVDEEVGALGRKHNAPKLDSFNMRAELEEGKFDEEGNYIRTAKDQKDSQDVWLRDVSRKDMESARLAVLKREREEAQRASTAKSEDEDDNSVAKLLAQLIPFLDRGETLLDTLARLGPSSATASNPSSKPRRRNDRVSGTRANHPRAQDRETTGKIERMTELANRLMAKSQLDIYDTEREGLMRAYQRETGEELVLDPRTEDDVIQDGDDWEFIWPGAEDQINGPYSPHTMKSWYNDGLLQGEGTVALVRRIGEISFVEANATLF